MSVSLIDGHIDRNKQKMTDDEIIQALEFDAICDFDHWVINLIKRYKAENERLQQNLKEAHIDIQEKQAEIKALISGQETLQKALKESQNEAKYFFTERQSLNTKIVREFAERLKEKTSDAYFFGEYYIKNTIDNLVKEMVGDTE